MPKLPSFPKPPRFTEILGGANPLRSALDDVRGVIISGKEGITSIASALTLEGDVLLPRENPAPVLVTETVKKNETLDTPVSTVEDPIKGGTAGTVCSEEHVSLADSELKEALRMARSRGIKDSEVRERLKGARDELNSMERRDMVAEKILTYPPEQQVIARWLLPKSAALRHSISEILMKDATIEDLEKASAMAAQTSREFTERIEHLPSEQKASDECLNVKQLKQFVEERHLK